MKDISKYFDENDLLCHLRPDMPGFECGDSCRESGTYASGLVLLTKLQTKNVAYGCPWADDVNMNYWFVRGYYETEKGIYIRHPHSQDAWHRDPKEFSRDQWQGLVAGMLLTGQIYDLKNLFTAHLKHPWRFQNKDITTYEWVWYFRGLKWWWLYPLICVLDLGLVINALIRIVYPLFDRDHVADDINFTTMLAIATRVRYPTPLAWLAWCIYLFRPQPRKDDGTLYQGHPIFNAWVHYYRPPTAPPMDELWRQIIFRWF